MSQRLQSIGQGFAMAMRQAPGGFTRLFLLNVVAGAAPAAVLYIQKLLIDGITGSEPGRGLGEILRSPGALAAAVGTFLVLNVVLDAMQQILSFETSTFRDKVVGGTKRLIISAVRRLRGIRPFETPEYASRLKLAVDSVPSIDYFGKLVNDLLIGLFTVVPLVALTATLAWWVPLIMVAAIAPSMYVQQRIADREWSLTRTQAETAKRMHYHERMLAGLEYAKETRLLGIGGLLLGRWQAMFDGALRDVLLLRARGRRTVLRWSLLSAVGVGGSFLFVVEQGMDGTLSAGDLALYIGSVFQLRNGLFMLISSFVELHAQGLRVGAIQAVLDTDDGLSDRPPAVRTASNDGLVFDAVTFRYAGAQEDAVRAVSFDVPHGRSVALVGANGSGKTTLVKLACRLYDPDVGTVSWNGRPLAELPVDEWRARVSALMQDHCRFPVSAFDNVRFGNAAAPDDGLEGVRAAARKSGIGERIERLPERWQTPLSRELTGGRDLSGGEWQRLALARAFYRSEAALVVLDEPTYGVDPAAEGDIWERVRSWIAGRTALVVSHRLGLTRFVDDIVVMDRGRVVERGDHAALMEVGGLYARMFETQARPYVD